MEQSDELPAGAFDELARIPLDDALDALDHIQRRKVLLALRNHNLPDDSRAVFADSKNDADALESRVGMDQAHLAKLVAYGFITWNRDTHEVTHGPNFTDIKPLLQLLADNSDELPAA